MPYIHLTRQWVRDVVVGCGFCPFAAHVYDRHLIRYRVAAADEDLEELVVEEAEWLDEHTETDTTLIIVPDRLDDFDTYLDELENVQAALDREDYEGIYQLASFHPEYRFEGSPENDVANYTNRSPFPMFHLLREESIDTALDHYKGDPEAIPERNIRFAREKGHAFFLDILSRLGK